MENTNRYLLGLILTAAIIVFSGFFFLHGLVSTVRPSSVEELTYNMPRPRSALYNFFFGLEGREIQRKEINPFKDKEAKTTAAAGSVRKPGDKKTSPAKTTATAQAAKPATAVAAKKPEVKVNVIPKDASNSGTSADGANRSDQLPTAAKAFVRNESGNTDTSGDDDKDGRLSASQWRSLVVAQPTKENVTKLIEAFNNKKVDAATLYLIMNDLVQSSNPETESAGLMIAQQVPSLRSFTVISNNYEKLDGTVKKSADAYFLSYMQASRLPILALALQSQDNSLVHRAAQVMVAGLQNAKPGTTPSTPTDPQVRPGRGVIVSSSKNIFAPFIPLFQNLEKSPDSSISGLAQNALGQLQALSNT